MFWMKSNGDPDHALTFAAFAVGAVLVKFLAAGLTVTIGTKVLSAGGPPDAGVIAALLMPTLGTYWGRKHTDANAPGGVLK